MQVRRFGHTYPWSRQFGAMSTLVNVASPFVNASIRDRTQWQNRAPQSSWASLKLGSKAAPPVQSAEKDGEDGEQCGHGSVASGWRAPLMSGQRRCALE